MSSDYITRSDVQEMIDASISNFIDLMISDDPLLTDKEKGELKAMIDPIRKANQLAAVRLISVARLARQFLTPEKERVGLIQLFAITKDNGGVR